MPPCSAVLCLRRASSAASVQNSQRKNCAIKIYPTYREANLERIMLLPARWGIHLALWFLFHHLCFSFRFLRQSFPCPCVHGALILGVLDWKTINLRLDLANKYCLLYAKLSAGWDATLFQTIADLELSCMAAIF